MAWNQRPEFNFNPSQLNWSGDFPAHVHSVMNEVRLSRGEVNHLSRLFFDLQKSLQRVWPGCEVLPFGSIVTGLGILSSDVDCYIHIPDNYMHNNSAKSVIKARNELRKHPWLYRDLFAITSAKVPILKLFHLPTGRHCDVSFTSLSGVRNSKLIAYLLHMDERAMPLMVLIKYWSKVHKLTGTNLLPNYALTMLTIFYLQQKNILPSVSTLQNLTNQEIVINKWNTAFTENYYHETDNTESIYELLGDFFKFYASFEFTKYIISPFVADSIPREVFKDLNRVPNDFDSYKTMASENKFVPLKIDTPMCIQDVFEHNRNCAVAVYPRLATSFSSYIQLAAKIYAESNSQYFLRQILMKKPNLPIMKPVKKKRPFTNPKQQTAAINKNITTEKPTEAKVKKEHDVLDQKEPSKNLKRPGNNLRALFMAGHPRAKKAKH